jgi:hypothetical protein
LGSGELTRQEEALVDAFLEDGFEGLQELGSYEFLPAPPTPRRARRRDATKRKVASRRRNWLDEDSGCSREVDHWVPGSVREPAETWEFLRQPGRMANEDPRACRCTKRRHGQPKIALGFCDKNRRHVVRERQISRGYRALVRRHGAFGEEV